VHLSQVSRLTCLAKNCESAKMSVFDPELQGDQCLSSKRRSVVARSMIMRSGGPGRASLKCCPSPPLD
jgi:hypothetical protein